MSGDVSIYDRSFTCTAVSAVKALVRKLIADYGWVHLSIGIFGNVCFLIGSVLFLLQQKTAGTWLFVVGASGMLLGKLGSAAVEMERQRG